MGILVQSTLPGGIKMREIDTGIKVTGHACMVSKFPTVDIGFGMSRPMYG
jgi:hypothetical protein